MRVTQFRKASFSANIFVSHKCRSAIPIRTVLTRDVLLQATLDPDVRSIEYLASTHLDGRHVPLDAIVVNKHGHRYALGIDGFNLPRSTEEETLVLVALSEMDIRPLTIDLNEIHEEPRHSSARLIWQHNQTTVNFDTRSTVLATLEDHLTLSIKELDRLISTRKPITTVISALACEGSVEIDLSQHPFGYLTPVRAGVVAFNSSGLTTRQMA